jgi:hypothetical protein
LNACTRQAVAFLPLFYGNGGPSSKQEMGELMENSPKHTPGPWERPKNDPGHGAIALAGDGNQLVCLVYGRDADEQSANSRLIKAAPGMLAALKEIASCACPCEPLGKCLTISKDGKDLRCLSCIARAAIEGLV